MSSPNFLLTCHKMGKKKKKKLGWEKGLMIPMVRFKEPATRGRAGSGEV